MILLDNSAWSRLGEPALSADRAAEIAGWLSEREVGVCLPFLLEAGYSARSAQNHRAVLLGLLVLPRIELNIRTEQRALAAQGRLAETGHHRLPPADLMVAACAHEARAGVLHYDAHFDVIAERSGLDFESVWLAPAGSL
jgi:predicted nucleic acid-binding protein